MKKLFIAFLIALGSLQNQILPADASAIADKKRSCVECGSKSTKKEVPIAKYKATEPKQKSKQSDSGVNFNNNLKNDTTGYTKPLDLYKKPEKHKLVPMGRRG